jgi:hypothetical protein
MQNNNNNPNRGKSYTPNKNYNNTTPEPEQKPTYLSSLFKPPTDPDEARAERDRLYGRTPQNTKVSSTFTY